MIQRVSIVYMGLYRLFVGLGSGLVLRDTLKPTPL